MIDSFSAPWQVSLTVGQHTVIGYFLLLGVFAFVAGIVRAWLTQSEVSTRYRSATVARFSVMAIAFAAYVVLVLAFRDGYDLIDGMYVPNATAIDSFAPRYVEWAVSVPLLTVELLAVCVISGAQLRRTRLLAMTGTFLMVLTGFLGAVVFGADDGRSQLIVWGVVSCVFWLSTTALLIVTVRRSYPQLTAEGALVLRNAATILLGGWVIYPVVYVLQILGSGGEWTTAIQVTLTLADILVKLAFGGLIHRIAKLRTAEDVRAGLDVHPEAIWISSLKQSDAGVPREVYLAADAVVHPRRIKPPEAAATAASPSEAVPDLDE